MNKLLTMNNSYVKVVFNYEPSPYRCFGPFYPVIAGQVKVSVERDLKHVLGIKLGFQGEADGYFNEVQEQPSFDIINSTIVVRNPIMDSKMLFDYNKDLSTTGGLISKGTVFNEAFEYRFPWESIYLPSSCANVGGMLDNQGSVAVVYRLYVKIKYENPLTKRTEEVIWPELVPYQGKPMTSVGGLIGMKDYVITNRFKSKVKSFVYDEKNKMLIPSPINSSHRHTRLIRSIFDGNYRKDNYDELTEDVDVSCVFSIPNAIDILGSFDHTVAMTFRIATRDNKSTDFSFNGQSTGLGKFNVRELSLIDYYQIDINVQGHKYSTQNRLPLMLLRFKPGSLGFDAKDFVYNKENGYWEGTVSLNEFPRATTSPMIQYFSTPALVYGRIEGLFSCKTTVMYELQLVDGSGKSKSNGRTFTALAESTLYFTNNDPPPQYSE